MAADGLTAVQGHVVVADALAALSAARQLDGTLLGDHLEVRLVLLVPGVMGRITTAAI